MSTVLDPVAVGDLNSTAKGTGARKSGGKVKFSLIPLHIMAGVARVMMAGCVKYAHWNWAKGMNWDECFDCGMRHLVKWWYMREDYEAETGEHHLDLAICNLLFARHYTLAYPEGDNRPPAYLGFGDALAWFNTKFDEAAYRERNGLTGGDV